jgi:hypothetical protein
MLISPTIGTSTRKSMAYANPERAMPCATKLQLMRGID